MPYWIDSEDLIKALGPQSCERCGPVEGLFCLNCGEFTQEGHREDCGINKQYNRHLGHQFQRIGDDTNSFSSRRPPRPR